ncbi:MAG: glutamine--fructose-6-phosphate transaminase (isomerizing) [Nitrososphaerota archaeon]|nr:glutamine--fructose-6-phosphate transaminase (isomerizing) [Aigarchaeota archaeon]MDW8076141.1 glutamine--fructose-6-phosphate transaminase (isomerizing) [Nitrososphaerota archaeon]
MCGITGCVSDGKNVAGILYKSLKRLEYRGYDSAGMATIFNGILYVKKDQGKIDEVNARLNFNDMPGYIGIAHTRWATHGAPSKVNAHPHTDCNNRLAIVHNGVIENFIELKKELLDLNHKFVSKTDTEVVAHLLEENLKREEFFSAFVDTIKRLSGSYAIAAIYVGEPNKILAAKQDMPLLIGVGDGCMFVASDAAAFIDETNRAIALQNGEVAVVTAKSYEIYRVKDFSKVTRGPMVLNWTLEMAEKQGFLHYTLKEIFEQPLTIKSALRLQDTYVDLLTEFLDRGEKIFLLAAGTSYHACLAASYMFSKLARLTTYPVIASEFIENYGHSIDIGTVILAVSQSGETADVLNALEFARLRAATILGITNVVGSTLTRISRAYLLQNAGPEIGVAATKTFTSQLTVLAQLALRLAKKRGKIAQYEMDEFKDRLYEVPDIVSQVLEGVKDQIRELAKKYAKEKFFIFLGRGISTATAFEGRLKVMELSYIPCIAYPAGESKHGPISIVEKDVPVIFVCPRDETRKTIIGNIEEMKARGAKIITIGNKDDEELMEISDDYVGLPDVHELLSPIVYTLPFQLLAYYLAIERGLDPDRPRNLAKSVTVL